MELPYGATLFIYGAGRGGRLIHDALWRRDDVTVKGFIDSARTGLLCGLPIHGPDSVPAAPGDLIVIASVAWEEIGRQLRARGFTNVWNAIVLVERKVDSFLLRMSDAHRFPEPARMDRLLAGFVPAGTRPPQPAMVPVRGGGDGGNGDGEAMSFLLDHPENARDIVAIGLWGRSGSYLLSNLLDGHPRALAVPPHSLHWILHFLAAFFTERDEAGQDTSMDAFIAEFLKVFRNILRDDQDPHAAEHIRCGAARERTAGVGRPEFEANLRHCLHRLHERGLLSIANIFRAIHVAYAAAAGHPLQTREPVILWQAHDVRVRHREFFTDILGPIRFVLCVRYPEKTLDAYFQTYLTGPDCPLGLMPVPRMLLDYAVMNDHRRLGIDDGRLVVIRFEDMHNGTRAVMEALSGWLGIGWDPCLLETTCDGEIIWFKSGTKFNTGTRAMGRADLRLTVCSRLDGWRLRYLFADAYRDWYGEERFAGLRRLGWAASCVEWTASLVPLRFLALVARRGAPSGGGLRAALAALLRETREVARLGRREARRRRERGVSPHPLLPVPSCDRRLR